MSTIPSPPVVRSTTTLTILSATLPPQLFKPIDLTSEWEVADRNQFLPFLLQYHDTLQQDYLLWSPKEHQALFHPLPHHPSYCHKLKELFSTIHEMMDELGKANIKTTLKKNTPNHPFLRRDTQTLGKQALRTGLVDVGRDVLSGWELKNSALQCTMQTVRNIAENVGRRTPSTNRSEKSTQDEQEEKKGYKNKSFY